MIHADLRMGDRTKMKSRVCRKTILLFWLLLGILPVLLAQTPPLSQPADVKLEGIVFYGEDSPDTNAIISGESVKTGEKVKQFKVLRIEKDAVLLEDTNTQEQFQYGITGEKKLVKARPVVAAPPQKGPFDFIAEFFGWKKKSSLP